MPQMFIPIPNKSVLVYVCSVVFIVCLYVCACECLLQNNNDKTKHKNNTNCGLVPSSQELLGYLITAIPSVCVPAVIGVLAVWIQQQTKTKQKTHTRYLLSRNTIRTR